MRKRIVMLLAIILITSAAADASPLAEDFGISFGHMGLFDDSYRSGLHTYLGVTKGITERLEMNLYVHSEITPRFFGDNQIGLDVAYSLVGKRWDANGYAGSGVNMLVSVGALAGMHNGSGDFGLDSLVCKLTPITVGTSHVGKRDRFCTVGIDWNIRRKSISFTWNFLISDIYLKGTWRDDPSLTNID